MKLMYSLKNSRYYVKTSKIIKIHLTKIEIRLSPLQSKEKKEYQMKLKKATKN
jgi:hypothetical protein